MHSTLDTMPKTADVYDLKDTPEDLQRLYILEKLGTYINSLGGDLDLSNGNYQQIRCIFKDHPEEDPSFTYYPDEDNTHYYCYGCRRYGDIFSLIEHFEGISGYNRQLAWATKKFGSYSDDRIWCQLQNGSIKERAEKRAAEEDARRAAARSNAEYFIKQSQELFAMGFEEAVDYIKERGLDYDFCLQKGMGYRAGMIVYPGDGFYICRNIPPLRGDQSKYYVSKGTGAGIFNEAHLNDKDVEEIFITEGFFDMLSIEQVGFKAIAFSPFYINKLIERLSSDSYQPSPNRVYIISMDNDYKDGIPGTGSEANHELLKKLTDIGIKAVIKNVAGTSPEDPKDANEALVKLGRDLFRERLAQIIKEIRAVVPKQQAVYNVSPSSVSDIDNGRRFVNQFGREVKYSSYKDTWYIYDGIRWKEDRKKEVFEKGKEISGIVKNVLKATSNGQKRSAKASRVESYASVRNLLLAAQSDKHIAIEAASFDRDYFKMNVLNGTIDLNTGELLPHNSEDLITKLAPVNFKPDAKSDVWDHFIDHVTCGDKDHAAYLQRVIGYSLTGSTEEIAWFIFLGRTSTGKSTFFKAIQSVLGDYSMVADSRILIQRGNGFLGGHTDELAVLDGKRTVFLEEIDEGSKLSVALIKRITTGGLLSVRALGEKTSSFPIRCKLLLAANSMPNFNAADDAIVDRIHLIPFTNQVPREERDRGLINKLDRDDVKEAILAWAVQGCLAWRKQGLNESKASIRCKDECLEDIDIIGRFIEDTFVEKKGHRLSNATISSAYNLWAERNIDGETKKPQLSKLLKQKKWMPYHTDGERGFIGYDFKLTAPVQNEESKKGETTQINVQCDADYYNETSLDKLLN